MFILLASQDLYENDSFMLIDFGLAFSHCLSANELFMRMNECIKFLNTFRIDDYDDDDFVCMCFHTGKITIDSSC